MADFKAQFTGSGVVSATSENEMSPRRMSALGH
jgi:hypothetical protein